MPGESIVTLAAYLVVCPRCEMHACIVLPDGRKTRQFASRKIGQVVIKLLAQGGCIDANEVLFLSNQLEAARYLRDENLPEEEISSLEEIFRSERTDRFDEDHDDPPSQYVM